MTLIRKLASVACLALLCLSYSASNAQTASTLDPTQIYNTGNLTTFDPAGSTTTSAWQNVGQWGGSLTCWAPGGPGYCGPQPYVNANGYGMINFSYGYTDLYQTVGIASALPDSGNGLRVNGYNFGFTAKNGNGWDGGATDYLMAYVNLYDPRGSAVFSKAYNLTYQFDWTNFNFSETFATPYATKDLSTARYGFVGYDTNYWAGPYGPEIYNVSFSLKYSVDPCFVNVLSSPSCPGYLDAIAKLSPTPTTTTTTEPIVQDPFVLSSPTVTTTLTTTNAVTQPTVNSTSTIDSTTTGSPTTTSSSSTSNTTVTPSATDPQPKVGEVSVPGSQPKALSTMSTTQLLSIVNNEQSRISKLEMSTAQSAVQQAQLASEQAMADSQSFVSSNLSQSTSTLFGIGPRSAGASTVALASTGVGLKGPEVAVNQTFQSSRPGDDRPTSENKDLTNNPVNNMLNQNTQFSTNTLAPATGPAVKKNVKDNDAAGGVTLASIARQPIGFESYMGIMQDRPFYPPKEIYKGQRVVDNVRAQRLLNGASDRLHQQMVDQQYGLGQ